jgi:hypothetical protein
MRAADPAQMFSKLPTSDKIRFLSRLGWELTLAGCFAHSQTSELINPLRLLAINDVQHRIFSHLYALASNDRKRYPDDELVAIVLAESRDRTLNEQVQNAFDLAAEFIQKNPS